MAWIYSDCYNILCSDKSAETVNGIMMIMVIRKMNIRYHHIKNSKIGNKRVLKFNKLKIKTVDTKNFSQVIKFELNV